MSPNEVRACYRLYAACKRNDPDRQMLLMAALIFALVANAAWIVFLGFVLFRVVKQVV